MRVTMGLLLLVVATGARGMESQDLQGLQLDVESVGAVLVVDGVPMRIRRAHGEDVPELVRRIALRWRAEGDATRPLQQRGWQMLARFRDGHSELIQWRGEGRAAELLYSSLNATRPPDRVAAAPFRLPSRCAWGRAVESHEPDASHVQRTAACRGSAGEVSRMLRKVLLAAGWQVRGIAGAAFELQREGVTGQLLIAGDERTGGSVLTWLGRHARTQGLP